jgi:hypothetical protein
LYIVSSSQRVTIGKNPSVYKFEGNLCVSWGGGGQSMKKLCVEDKHGCRH